MAIDLKDDKQLSAACESALQAYRTSPGYMDWTKRLSVFLQKVQEADREEFFQEAFQERLWNSEAVSATGMGHVKIAKVLQDPQVTECLWQLKSAQSAGDIEQQLTLLVKTWNQVNKLIAPLVSSTPRLKMHRLFAALSPQNFTTIAHFRKLRELGKTMGVSLGADDLTLHRRVLDRLEAVLGTAAPFLSPAWVERMTLPWLLYVTQLQEQETESTEISDLATGEEKLNPLPADRRRRGLLAIGGHTSTIRAMIEFAKEGCTREDLREHLRSINPNHATSTLNTQMNVLIAEWGVLKASGDSLQLTPRGESFLESGDPDEVSDWLLTRILGFDNLIALLRGSPLPNKVVIAELQKVNTSWTSTFVPNALINWGRALNLVESLPDKNLSLTERGESWAARIHWTPGILEADQSVAPQTSAQATSNTVQGPIQRPTLVQIIESFGTGISFRPELIAQLDAGLWGHPRRHFAVLTGLSGAGKTVLARGYALGLWHAEANPEVGLLTVPVQPGWHDPSCLLGYINPLDSEVYVRTGFLDFLLQASGDPDRAYTVVLDEMNLSHPEQYLAPLLSAMETGDQIELHAQGNEVNGIPAAIAYPNNLVIIGTVNMDETTHGLSDKVLDRASVIEFWDINVDDYPGWKNSQLSDAHIDKVRETLKALVVALRPVRLHFGWRTISDVLGYIREAERGAVIGFESALDQAVYSKVLPKLRGEDTPRIQNAFTNVRMVLNDAQLSQSESKVGELLDDLKFLGSARFWR